MNETKSNSLLFVALGSVMSPAAVFVSHYLMTKKSTSIELYIALALIAVNLLTVFFVNSLFAKKKIDAMGVVAFKSVKTVILVGLFMTTGFLGIATNLTAFAVCFMAGFAVAMIFEILQFVTATKKVKSTTC